MNPIDLPSKLPLKVRHLIEKVHDQIFMADLEAKRHPELCRFIEILYADMPWLKKNMKKEAREHGITQ